MIGIGVIGYGYWGPNLVRNFSLASGMEVKVVSDLRPRRLEQVKARYPSVKITTNHAELIDDPNIKAVAIATPVSTHFDLAMAALRAGKHVWVEKPLTSSSEQAMQLIEEAQRRNLVLHVDHTFIYTGAVRRIKELVSRNELGEIYYYDSVRVNLGLFQYDVNVVWDLAVHDLSIIDYVLPCKPIAVSATGIGHIANGPENIAYLTLFFEGNMIAHLHVNWLAPLKIRRTLIGGSRKMIVYDDLEPSEKVKVYDKGIDLDYSEEDIHRLISINYRTGDMWAPSIDNSEALLVEAKHFIRCVEGRDTSLTDGHTGLRVVKILEAATESIKQQGKPFELARYGGCH